MERCIEIAGRRVGPGEPVYVVAEISANHLGSLERAERLVREAKACGADAVKLQTYTPETMTLDCPGEPFRIPGGGPWAGRTLYDLYAEAHTPWAWHPRLLALAGEVGIPLFSTPCDPTAVDFLERLGTPAYKVGSFELVDPRLLRRVAGSGRPVILSTGMATFEEIGEAVATVRGAGGRQLALLKCTSSYPASPAGMHLRTIPHLAEAFGVPVGLSDHSLRATAAVAAVALGASIVEKHFCLSRAEGGPDAAFSLEPAELASLVAEVRLAEQALGEARYGFTEEERRSRLFRRSLFVVRDVSRGEPFTEENVRAIRPGHGLLPRFLDQVLGRRAAQDIPRGTPLNWPLIEVE